MTTNNRITIILILSLGLTVIRAPKVSSSYQPPELRTYTEKMEDDLYNEIQTRYDAFAEHKNEIDGKVYNKMRWNSLDKKSFTKLYKSDKRFKEMKRELLGLCGEFKYRFPRSRRMIEVLSIQGEIFGIFEEFDNARDAYLQCLENEPLKMPGKNTREQDATILAAIERIANTYYVEATHAEKAGRFKLAHDKYDIAKSWYTRLGSECKVRGVLGSYDRARLVAGVSAFKSAEMLGAGAKIKEVGSIPKLDTNEDFLIRYPPLRKIDRKAVAKKTAEAEGYETTAKENVDTDIGRVALGRAADTYYAIRDWENAARVYLFYIENYPCADDVMTAYEAAVECHKRAQKWGAAAKVYLGIANHPKAKGTLLGSGALFRAALMYEQQQDWPSAELTFHRLINEYPDRTSLIVEAVNRETRAREKQVNKETND